MSLDQNREPQRMEEEALRSSTGDLHDQSQLRHLILPEKRLLSTLELLQAYQTVLQADMNLARLFDIPLASDLKAEGLGSLFSKRKPHILEADQAGCAIHWADVVLSRTYESKPQSDGNRHVRVDKGRALLEVSKEDHDFIATGLPRQLVDPHSYPSDVASEINIVKLTRSQIAPWRDLALQLNQTIDNVLAGLSERMETLQQKYLMFELQGNISGELTRIGSETPITSKNSDVSPMAKQGKKRKGRNHSWTLEEARDLPGWFEQHRNLSEKEIEEQYLLFSGQDRSYPSLQAQLYKQGFGYLCNKKKKPSHRKHVASQLPPSTPKLSATKESTGPTQLSVAMGIISRSLCPFQQQSSGTQTIENEFELGASPESQEGRSLSEKTASDPERAAEPDCSGLTVTRLGSCEYRSPIHEVAVHTNETVGQSKDPLATVSPDLHSSVSRPIECRSDFECFDEPQESWSEPAGRSSLGSHSPIPSNLNEPMRVQTRSLPPAESSDGTNEKRRHTLKPISTTDEFSVPITYHSPAITDHANSTEACSKEKSQGHENRSMYANVGHDLSHKLNPESADHVPLRVATVKSISQEPQDNDPQPAGSTICVPQDTGIAGKNELQMSETPSNNRVEAQRLTSRTPFSPPRDTTSGYQDMIPTESGLTVGRRLRPPSADGQQVAESASRWQHFQEINTGGDEIGFSNSMGRQPGNYMQDTSYAESTPLVNSLALQSAGEISSEEAHRSMVSSPVAQPPQGDLHVVPEHIVQTMPKKKRAFSRRTKTGCITCRNRKTKCDEQKPSCGNCMGASYRCEGYKKPVNWQRAIAPAMSVSARPLEHHTEATGHDRFLQTERCPAREIDLTTTHASRSPVQQSIHKENKENKENSESGSIAWLPNDNRSIHENPSSVWPAGSCNQQPMSTYATLPLSGPRQKKWTIPTIHEVLQRTGNGSDIPFVSRSSRE